MESKIEKEPYCKCIVESFGSFDQHLVGFPHSIHHQEDPVLPSTTLELVSLYD